MDDGMKEREAKAAAMDKATAKARNDSCFNIGDAVRIDASFEVLNGADKFDQQANGGVGAFLPPTEKVSVKNLQGHINAEPYYSERHKELVYPVMEAHPAGGLVGVPQSALKRPLGPRIVAGWDRLYERGYEMIFGKRPIDVHEYDEEDE